MMFSEIWFRGLSEKDKKDLANALTYSDVRRRLEEILLVFMREVETPSRKDYDNPNWAYKQAHYNGELLAYQKILTILRPKDE